MPPSDTGLVISSLEEQGWKGLKVWSAGTAAEDLIKSAGAASDGTYMALAGDFSGGSAPPIQRRLEAEAMKEMGQHINAISLSAWDSTMAIRAAMEKAQSVDPAKVREALPGVVFDSSYGPAAFGGKAEYGSPQQMLLPILISQIKDGKVIERNRIIPAELKERLASLKP
jgi:branched-chain amino acid transport system substrate-binding protein